MKIQANGKINLVLNITDRRDDGYHDLKMITYPIALADDIEISKNDIDQVVYDVPVENDIVSKTLKMMKNSFHIKECVKVKVNKHIPIGYGFGGGSADAAAIMLALNQMWKLGATDDELAHLGKSIGADVPFFIYNKPALVRGIGEQIFHLPRLESYVLLVIPELPTKTVDAFKRTDLIKLKEKDTTQHLITIGKQQVRELSHICFNDFLQIAQQTRDNCYYTVRTLQQVNPDFSLTGTGSGFFALYQNLDRLKKDEKILSEMGYQTIFSHLL